VGSIDARMTELSHNLTISSSVVDVSLIIDLENEIKTVEEKDRNRDLTMRRSPELRARLDEISRLITSVENISSESHQEEPIVEEFDVPWFDETRPRPTTKYTLGIDLGSSKLRYNLFSSDHPESAIHAQVIDARAHVDRSGEIFVSSEGVSPPSDSAQLPSLQRLFGRNFAYPGIASVIARYPFPIVEDPETHQCAVDLGGRLITPERVATGLFTFVRKKAEEIAGQKVVDASIGVPALFTSAQRTSVRTAAENAGLHVLHIIAGTLLAARAMKATGRLGTLGQALIVDVGASKIEVSLVQNTGDAIRELRTVGMHDIGTDDIRDNIVDLCLELLEGMNENLDSFMRVKLCSAVEVALESESDSPRIIVLDLGNEKKFAKELTDSEIALACEQVTTGLKQLIDELVAPEGKQEVKVVCCIGGGTMLTPARESIRSEFPDPDFAQLDPNSVVFGEQLWTLHKKQIDCLKKNV
jgi:molecular chaperone DnaK